jgi:exo-beta-1,3-glucanase (GH17 family)
MTVDVLNSLQSSRAWINYSPAKPFDMVLGRHPVAEEQLLEELTLLYDHGFRGLVTNSMTYGCEAAPRIAKGVGFDHVAAKLWWATDESLTVEKRNLAEAIDFVDAIVVGNETVNKAINRGDPPRPAFDRLKTEIETLQARHGIPVTTGLHPSDWRLFPEIATELGDFVFANLQPWWVLHRNDPHLAAAWVADAIQVIRDTPGMPPERVVLIQEAAYPSGALPPGSAPGATPAAQAAFYESLIASGEQFVYGFSFDAYFATASSPPGGFGGLWDSERNPKPAVSVLDLGPYRR